MSHPSPHTHPLTSLASLFADARRHLELERAYGVDAIAINPDHIAQFTRKDAAARKSQALDALRQELESCNQCELGERRQNLVFGVGNPDADLMFVGEAPGQREDEQGIPFVGAAGQLLTRIIQAIGLSRDQVYIANILKCRPPNNRTPSGDESAACFPNLFRQIEILRPRIIVALGNPAMKTLLQTTQSITRMRGRFVMWHEIEVMPTFHPSYLLRNPAAKRDVWQDLQKVHAHMRELGLAIGDLKRGN